jgi:hypothetical protein
MSLFNKKNKKSKEKQNFFLNFVLLKINPGYEHQVYHMLFKTPQVIELHPLLGEWDYFTKIITYNYDDILDLKKMLQAIEGINYYKILNEVKIDRLPKNFKKSDTGFIREVPV